MSFYDDSSLPFVPQRDIPLINDSIPFAGSMMHIFTPPCMVTPPTVPVVEEARGRSRSRSRSRSHSRSRSSSRSGGPRRLSPVRIHVHSRSRHRSRTRSRSRSRSSSPRWRRCPARRRRSDSPFMDNLGFRPYPSRSSTPIPIPIIQQPPTQPPIIVVPQGPPMSPPSPSPWYCGPPSVVWQVPKQPVDILTFHYNKNMAYAPAAKTYDVRPFFLSCV
jgi:hypothetical protein